MDVCAEAPDAGSAQPVAHRCGGLGGVPIALPCGADHPRDVCRLAGDGGLYEPDGRARTSEPDDPVEPCLQRVTWTRHLCFVTPPQCLDIGRLSAGELVERSVREHHNHVRGIVGM